MTEKHQKYTVKWDTYPPLKKWLFFGFLAGAAVFLLFTFKEDDPGDFSSALYLGLILFAGTRFFPVINRNFFVDIFIALILSFLVAYFLGPIFYQFLGGNELLGYGLISPLYVIPIISSLKDWKRNKKK